MINPATCVCMLLAAGSGLYLYQAKHQAQLETREIRRVLTEADAARARIAVLATEYALENDQERLKDFAAKFLPQLKPTQPGQFTTLAELDNRLPPVGLPPASLPPASLPQSTTPQAPAEAGVQYDYPPAPDTVPVAQTTPSHDEPKADAPHPVVVASRPSNGEAVIAAPAAAARPAVTQAANQAAAGTTSVSPVASPARVPPNVPPGVPPGAPPGAPTGVPRLSPPSFASVAATAQVVAPPSSAQASAFPHVGARGAASGPAPSLLAAAGRSPVAAPPRLPQAAPAAAPPYRAPYYAPPPPPQYGSALGMARTAYPPQPVMLSTAGPGTGG